MEACYELLAERDAVLKELYEQYGVPHIPSRPQGFITLCKLILEQQVSLASAKACFLKLEAKLVAITPESVLNATDEELRSSTVSRQKSVYLKELANAVLSNQLDLESLSKISSEQVRDQLLRIKGIGNWTVDVYLMFALGDLDLFPIGDITLVTTMKELYQCSSKEEMIEISNGWKPYRSLATYLFWHHYLEKRGRKPLIY
jgi:DNA-3-methyladenine glycosylase II